MREYEGVKESMSEWGRKCVGGCGYEWIRVNILKRKRREKERDGNHEEYMENIWGID